MLEKKVARDNKAILAQYSLDPSFFTKEKEQKPKKLNSIKTVSPPRALVAEDNRKVRGKNK